MIEKYNLTYYPCPVCSGSTVKNLYKIKGFAIVQCETCRLVFVNPRINDKELYSIYVDRYFRNEDNGYEDYELTAHLRIKTFQRWYDEIKPFLKTKSGTALDIGCAAGYFLDVLKQHGWQAEGIELEKEMLSNVKKKGYPIYNTPLEYFEEKKKYKLITLFDVIEHLPNIHANLEKLATILDTDGTLTLVTPDFNSRQRKIFNKRWFQFKPKEHIQYFTKETLHRAVKLHGFRIIHTSSSGQYADTSFLYNRLKRYGFTFSAHMFKSFTDAFGLSNKSWYADTGSMLVILQKKD